MDAAIAMQPLKGEQIRFEQLTLELLSYSRKQFTGRLDIQLTAGQQWSVYMSLGNLVWASGGSHPLRRWRRLLASHCPGVNPNNLTHRSADRFECWDYHCFSILAQRESMTEAQIQAVIRGSIVEVLFDLIQALEKSASDRPLASASSWVDRSLDTSSWRFFLRTTTGTRPSETNTYLLRSKLTLAVEPTLALAQKMWEQWVREGLDRYSPNLAPRIAQPQKLQQQTTPQVYKNLASLIRGQHSLRDLAVMTKRDLLSLARSLMPYIKKSLITLAEVPDAARSTPIQGKVPQPPAPTATPTRGKSYAIACIDDSPQICLNLEKILSGAGHQCMPIQESLQALPLLLQHKPDLIFLDITMPVVNGYELCSQLRRVSHFKTTPIIILTGNDGLVDRVRAKIAGATDFLSKPVDSQQVLDAVRKHLSDRRVMSYE